MPDRTAGPPASGEDVTTMRRFTVYRRGDLSATHNDQQAAPPDQPQYEGVVFSDGRVALRWLTPLRSTSCWDSLEDALGVHGHPEPRYGTELVWHDPDLLSLAAARLPAAPSEGNTASALGDPDETTREIAERLTAENAQQYHEIVRLLDLVQRLRATPPDWSTRPPLLP